MDGKEVGFTVRLFREGETYVAHVPELDISSCGDTEAETRRNVKDAVAGFLNTAEEQGTLVQVLEEAGYQLEGGRWREPEILFPLGERDGRVDSGGAACRQAARDE